MYNSPDIVKMAQDRLQEYRKSHLVYDNDAFNDMLAEFDEVANAKLNDIRHDDSHLQWKRNIEMSIEQQIREVFWPKLIACLERYIAFVHRVSLDFYNTYKNDPDDRFCAHHSIHARACQLASAILTLLQHGYADEAYATWRTLYELEIVSYFINRFERDGAAKSFLAQAESPFPASGAKNYEWAAKTLNRKRINFAELEEIATSGGSPEDKDHRRFKYRFASKNVHAIPQDMKGRLSKGMHRKEEYLNGASVLGLGFPSLFTANSLGSITVDFLVPRLDDSEFIFVINFLRVLYREIQEVQREEHQIVEYETKADVGQRTTDHPHFFYA